MDLKPLVLAAAAAALMAFAPAKKPAKPAPPAPAATLAPPKAAAAEARDPEAWTALLAAMGAQAQFADRQADAVKLKVVSPAGDFEMQFGGCQGTPRRCAGVLFDAADAKHAPTPFQVNRFNQASFACRMTLGASNYPHVLYSSLLFPSQTRDDMGAVLAGWQGCIADFGAFLKDPDGYLAAAP
jgi:hypothetical protein